MKKMIVNYICLTILIIGIILFSSNYVKVKADSGWDTDYDSSSWDSGTSFDSSSSWDADSSYSGSGSFGIFDLMILIFVIILVIYILKRNKKVIDSISTNTPNIKFISQEEANKVIPNFDIEEFNFQAYKIFYDVQIAWMNFDYDKLKELLTDELYNTYLMDLEALKIKNQKNTMKNFKLIKTGLISLVEENNTYIAKVLVNAEFYDYIEDMNTGKILRGTSDRKINNIYILTFVKSKEEKKIDICPRCGAEVKGNATGVCEYCNSKLINDTYDWVMSKKEKISQK